MMLHAECRVGQVVELVGAIPAHYKGETYVIVKVNPKKVRIQGQTSGKMLNADPGLLQVMEGALAPQIVGVPYRPARVPLQPGQVVRWERAAEKGYPANTVWVVLVDKDVRVNIAVLGGDPKNPGLSYWRVNPETIVPLRVPAGAQALFQEDK
jgi:hypothetical protein